MVIRRILNREPIWRRVEDRIDDAFSNARNAPGDALRENVPSPSERNIGGGIAVGAIEAGIALVLEETVGLPFGSDTEVVDTEPTSGGTLYTVNVDAPFRNMSRARAFFEANTGFTSLLTDRLEVDSVEVLRTRPLRDTYQVEILVED